VYGAKQLKKAPENDAVKRFYYRFATSICNAKLTNTSHNIQNQTITTNEVNGVHNHPPPSAPSIDSEICLGVKQVLSNGMGPSTILKELVLQSQEASVTNVLMST